jgi:RNA recognition motif-containing protein
MDEYDEDDVDMEPVRKPRARKPTALSTGTKLSVSNLDRGVTETDVKDLFSDVGELKSYRLIVDDYNESTGNAEVVFKSKADAMDAIDRCKTNFYDFFSLLQAFLLPAQQTKFTMARCSNVIRPRRATGRQANERQKGRERRVLCWAGQRAGPPEHRPERRRRRPWWLQAGSRTRS